MAYKAVMNKNRYTICHAGVGYTYDWQKKAHSKANGQYVSKPDFDRYYNNPNNYDFSRGGSTSSSGSTGGSSSNTSTGSSTSSSGPTNYTRENPYNLTNDELKERNTRAQLLNNYEKNYGSTQQDIEDFAKKSNELVDKGAAFAKKIAPTPSRTQLDLSRMTNQELNDYINRARLEQQYNDYYNPPKPDKTRDYIDIAATGLGLLISSAGVAASIIVPIALAKKKGGN